METRSHIPVLLEETIEALGVRAGGRYVDGTLGRAGHAEAILARGGLVIGIDRDDDALSEVAARKAAEPERLANLTIARGNHGDLVRIVRERGWDRVDGVLLDLGVSSPQLDEAERGFSFAKDGPLDMRMDRSRALTAADLVNNESAESLAETFRTLGEEPHARRIAQEIERERAKAPIETTARLAEVVARVAGRRGGKNPATRVFQALRMAVNDEMGELARALEGGAGILARGGRFAVITFESLTDRVVKRFFADHVGRMESLQQGGARWRGARPRARAVTHGAVVARDEEISRNPRARSAKLRAVEIEEESI